jgi:hypothetical protein
MADALPPESEQIRGVWLVVPVILVFLVPPTAAILGAWIADRLSATRSPFYLGLWQFAGVAAGFVVGVVLAKLLSRIVVRRGVPGKRA